MNAADDTREVRASEALDWPRLERWLREALPVVAPTNVDWSQPMVVSQFPGGHSNLTYAVSFGERSFVIRRPPLGPVPPTSHDMAREYRWLTAISPLYPLAPRAFAVCEDLSVVGAVFYVMERRRGLVIRHAEPPEFAGHAARRRAVGLALVDALADLHRLDTSTPSLAALSRNPAGFVGRQVTSWTERWQQAKTTNDAAMDAVAAWLADNLPPAAVRHSVVHGDFKLDNVILDPHDPSRLVAVLDWEMVALGHPLIDLGILLAYWSLPGTGNQHDALSTVTALDGWPTPAELVERYAMRTGIDTGSLRFFEVFGLFKVAVIIQQIYARYAKGQTDDPRFAGLGGRVGELAARAASVIRDTGPASVTPSPVSLAIQASRSVTPRPM